jgi:crotonobetainyl-CoA:carnitine CoA-transferase CaiB-like acyl-CoA transferase
MHLVGASHLAGPAYAQNHQRVAHRAEIEEAISKWTRTRSAEEVERFCAEARVPVGRVVSVREIVEGEQMRARGAVQEVWVPRAPKDLDEGADVVGGEDGEGEGKGWQVKIPGTFPRLEGCDPRPRWAGPDLGAHTEEVLMGDLGLSAEEMERLRGEGVIE